MRIIQFNAENFKRLKAVEIRPEGNVVVIRGRNAQGKSSILDAIWAALGGKAAVPDKPIRDGEDHAVVTLDIGDYIVTRTFTEKDSYLTVKTSDGAKIMNPQQILDGIVGEIAFDPFAFSEMKPQDQARQLALIADIDFDEINRERKETYDKRTDANRETKRLVAEIAGVESRYPDATDVDIIPVDVAELTEEYEAAQSVVRDVAMLRSNRQNHANILAGAISRAVMLRNQLDIVDKEIAEEKATISEIDEILNSTTVPDVDSIKKRLSTASDTNKRAADLSRVADLRTSLKSFEGRATKLTDEIEEIDTRKRDMIEQADLPVNGLAFDENGVTFKGIPFGQCSDSEKLKISVALAMRLNPKLRVIRITDGSLLDPDSIRMLEALTESEDFQLWIEKVDVSADGPGVLIEDGTVQS